ncbi:MAG: RNA methyltransferase [Thermoactinomyces sp.]|jgi:RNA methyltransferase, TrmH family
MTKIRLITSSANEQVKQWKKLKTKKGRSQQGALFIEGEHLIEEALNAKIPFLAVLLEQGKVEVMEPILRRFPEQVPVYELVPTLFHRLVETETPQGIAAVIRLPEWSPASLFSPQKQEATYLLLDAIQDPGNLGTIIRTAKAAGVDGILLGKGTVDPFNAKVVRAAMGSIFRIPLVQVDLADALSMLNEQGVTVVGTTPHAGVYHFDYSYPKRVAILLGNEGRGVNPDLLARVDVEVKIPMPGQTESLNVSAVGAILLYERVRQQYQHK